MSRLARKVERSGEGDEHTKTGRGGEFDFAAFKDAFESKDLERWAPFYAGWIEYRHVSQPRAPNQMVGKQRIADFLAWVCSADFGNTVADEVIGAERIAFIVDRAFPDGKRVFGHVIASIEDGKFTRQADVEARDE